MRRERPPDFQQIFESAPDVYLVLTPDFRIVAASDAFLRATWTEREQILGRPIFELFPNNPDDPQATGERNLRASLERVRQWRTADSMPVQKYDIRRPDGGFEERHWNPLNWPVLDRHGAVEYIVHRVEDMTELVRASQRAQEEHQRAEVLQQSNVHLRIANRMIRNEKARSDALLVAYQRSERFLSAFQLAVLPVALPDVPRASLDAYYHSGRSDAVVGGDWYDALPLDDGRLVVSMGDVSGSGLPAAITMAALRQIIRGVAYVHADPVMIVNAANKALLSEHRDTFASAFVGVLDPIAMRLTYTAAGHPAPLLRTPDGNVSELPSGGVWLGVPGNEHVTTHDVRLEPDAMLVLYTDGLIEASRDVISGLDALHEAVSKIAVAQIEKPARALYDALLPSPPRDDVAILTVCMRAARSGDDSLSRWVFEEDDADAAQRARHEFAQRLAGIGADAEDIYAAELVFGELVGNVVRHARGPIEVIADWSGLAPVLHVRDRGKGFTYTPRLPRDPLEENGRGLYLVATLSDDFNVTRRSQDGSHARAVMALHRRRATI